ncbi:MAG: FtsX-like permease family protein [Pseudomonadota bacterium]
MLAEVAWNSLLNRKKTVVLTFLSLLVSISVLISVEYIRVQAKDSFNRTVSGVDLIVGAPSGELNLLLYSVFRMGSSTNNIKYESLQVLEQDENVAWAIPISLGDSHKGFRVVGTNGNYFTHFKYGNARALSFDAGGTFDGLFETVLGAEVAKRLNYQLGDEIIIAHGIGRTSFQQHDKTPFTIVGILEPTGTPVDKTVHVSLEAIEAIHLAPGQLVSALNGRAPQLLEPKQITSVLLGLNSKFTTFGLQRQINNYEGDRLMAVLPGVAMARLWELMANVENMLRIIGFLVLIASLFGLATMLLATMNERKAEIAVLRILGASPATVMSLILIEALAISVLALISSTALVSVLAVTMEGWLSENYGLFLSRSVIGSELFVLAGLIIIATLIAAVIPAIEAYQRALHSQLSAK